MKLILLVIQKKSLYFKETLLTTNTTKYVIGLIPSQDTDWGLGRLNKDAEWETTYGCDPHRRCFAYWENDDLKYTNDPNRAKRFDSQESARRYLYDNGSSFLAKSKYHTVFTLED